MLPIIMFLAVISSPDYSAGIIQGSFLPGELTKYSVYIHGVDLYYALRDHTSNFDTNNLARCAYIIRNLVNKNPHIQKDLLNLYYEPSCDEHRMYLLGLLYNAGMHEFVNSERPFVINIINVCIDWKYADKKPEPVVLRGGEYASASVESELISIIVAALWTIGETGDSHYLESIRDILWRFNRVNLVISDSVRTIAKIGDPRGKDILREFLETFHPIDERIRNEAEKVVTTLSQ